MKLKKRNIFFVIGLLAVVSAVGLTSAKYITEQIYKSTPARVAEFHYTVNGLDNDSTEIPVKLLATTKAIDSVKTDRGSFVDGAYVVETYKVYNDSEVAVTCNIDVKGKNNDNRILCYTTLGNDKDVVADISSVLSNQAGVDGYPDKVSDFTAAQVADLFNKYESSSISLKPRQNTSVYAVFWCEHDSVFPASDAVGVAKENSAALADLSEGVPSDTYELKVNITQED